MKSTYLMALAGTAGIMIVSSAEAALLLNGDFETPNRGSSMNGSQFLTDGTSFSGWTVIGAPGANVNVDQTFAPTPYWTGNNSQFLDLTGNTGGGGVISDPFATISGVTYEVTFNALNGSTVYPVTPYTGSAFSLQASSALTATVYTGAANVLPGVPTIIDYFFTANAATTTLTFLDTSGFDSNAGWIDNVGVTAVPEASTVIAGLLLLFPFGASALRVLRCGKLLTNSSFNISA